MVAALKRYEAAGVDRSPGQDVEYVVIDDDERLAERVRLPFETIEEYDAESYTAELIRAAESIVSPLGWGRDNVRRFLCDTEDSTPAAFD